MTKPVLLRIALLLAVICACGVGAAVTFHQEKPIELILANTEFKVPPPSLDEMIHAADQVVFGRVLGGESKVGGFYHKTQRGITTFYRFRPSEVLHSRGDRSLGEGALTIVRDGGAIDRGNKIEKLEVVEFPQFELGHAYVLFLWWNEEHGAWTPAWGPHGTFEVKAGRVLNLGTAPIAKEQAGLSVEDFLAKLRR